MYLDGSFASFVNSTETMEDEASNFQMVFHNKALLKILALKNVKELNEALSVPLFVNREQGNALSILSTVNSRYSDDMLAQPHIFKRKQSHKQPTPARAC